MIIELGALDSPSVRRAWSLLRSEVFPRMFGMVQDDRIPPTGRSYGARGTPSGVQLLRSYPQPRSVDRINGRVVPGQSRRDVLSVVISGIANRNPVGVTFTHKDVLAN